MKCNGCNAEISMDAKFCGHCGHPIQIGTKEENYNAIKYLISKKKCFLIGVVLTIIAALFLLIFIPIQNDKIDWETAIAINTCQSYKEYLLIHPQGKYCNMANKEIKEFEQRMERSMEERCEKFRLAQQKNTSSFIDERDGKTYKTIKIGNH